MVPYGPSKCFAKLQIIMTWTSDLDPNQYLELGGDCLKSIRFPKSVSMGRDRHRSPKVTNDATYTLYIMMFAEARLRKWLEAHLEPHLTLGSNQWIASKSEQFGQHQLVEIAVTSL